VLVTIRDKTLDVDRPLLRQQRDSLLAVARSGKILYAPWHDAISGVVNLLDAMLDAEEELPDGTFAHAEEWQATE
jgi:hypothetical protein